MRKQLDGTFGEWARQISLSSSAALQRKRKTVVSKLEHLWPSIPESAVTTYLSCERRPRSQGLVPEGLPPIPEQMLYDWQQVREEESIREVTSPCVVTPRLGVIFVNRRIVWNSSDRPERERDVNIAAAMFPSASIPEAILLHNHWASSYFHFYNDFLSKVIVANRLSLPPNIPFIVPAHIWSTPFFKQVHDCGFFGNRQVVLQKRSQSISVGKAYLVRSFDCDIEHFDEIGRRIRPPIASPSDDRLFIIRNQRFGRRFRNQEEITTLLRDFGFQLFQPDAAPLQEQARRFANASIVCGAHGAGLVNIMFRRSRMKLVEIFNSNSGTPHYWMMCRQRGFQHASVIAQAMVGKGNRTDSLVNVAQLESALREAVHYTEQKKT